MIVSTAWAGKRYAVLGLARSGLATVRALAAAGAFVVAWDQDAAAVEHEYWKANGHATAVLIRERAEGAAKDWAVPEGPQWAWVGRRSDGAEFTAESLGLYFAHDLVHHAHDVDV